MSLLNHFTTRELLTAAAAADAWPKNRAACFGLTYTGSQFVDYMNALDDADFL